MKRDILLALLLMCATVQAIANEPSDAAVGETYGARVNAFSSAKVVRLWSVHLNLKRLRANVAGVKQLAGRPERR
jgi:hypothetical protein